MKDCGDVRVLVNEAGGIVDLVVDDEVKVLLGRVILDLSVRVLLRHLVLLWCV